MSLLDEIATELEQLTDEEIQEAALKIQEQRAKARSRPVSEETKQRMKEREKRRRKYNSELLKLAKERGLVPEKYTEEASA